MSTLMQKLGVDQLTIEQRIALIEEIWASIDFDAVNVELLSDAQRAELEMRINDETLDEEDLNDLWEIEELNALMRGRH
jgi:putative addiction module component (TIGR02574 family)